MAEGRNYLHRLCNSVCIVFFFCILFFLLLLQRLYSFLPAVVDFKNVEINSQRLAVWNVDPISTVHVVRIVVWISRTKKLIVLHISTAAYVKN